MAGDQKLQALLELERRGELPPTLAPQLDMYRKQGLAKPLGGGKALPDSAAKRYDEELGIYGSLKSASGSFTDDYAGNIFGGLENSAQAVTGSVGTPGQRDWWAGFNAVDNQIRNQLFGASLTDSEKAAYTSTTVSPSMAPAEVRKNIGRRLEIVQKAMKRRTNFLKKNGYNPGAVDELAGEYLPDFSDAPAAAPAAAATVAPAAGDRTPPAAAIPPASPPAAPPPLDPGGQGDIGFNQPAAPPPAMTGPQQAAYDAFMQANPSASEEQIVSLGKALGFDVRNAADIVKARGEGAGVAPASVAKLAPQDVDATTAGILGAGDAVTAGLLPRAGAVVDAIGAKLGGDTRDFGEVYDAAYGANRATLDKAQEDHPYATLAGNVAGLVGGGAVLGRVPGVASMAARMGGAAPAAGDLAYGSAYGFNRTDGDIGTRLLGGVTGGAAGAAGGVLGRGLARGAGALASPSGGALRPLYDAGVRPTLGQRFSGGGVLGRAVNGIEEGMQSFPIAGFAVKGSRDAAREQFETGAFNSALSEVGDQLPAGVKSGNAAHAYMQKTFNDAYDNVRSQMSAVADSQFLADKALLDQSITAGGLTDESARRFARIVDDAVERRSVNGALSGDAYKSAVSDIGKKVRALRDSPSGDRELADALDEYTGLLDQAARRASPPEAVAALDAADRGYAKAVRIEEAAKARGGGSGRFSPTQFDRSVQKTSGGTRSRAYLSGNALMQDYAEAGLSLVDRLPNSGTTDRLLTTQAMAGGLAGGALTLGASPTAILGLGAATLPYLPGARKIATGLIAPRQSAKLRTLGDVLRGRRAQLTGGAIGTPLALQYVGE